MKMSERRAAAAARNKKHLAAMASEISQELQQEAKPALPAHVTYLGVRNGKPHYRAMGVATEKPRASELFRRWAESRAEQHQVGGICPHCKGTGRYVLHTRPGERNKCYRCDGKGTLNAKDLAFLNRRLGGAGPICWATTAAAA